MKAIICKPAPEAPQAPRTVEEDFEGDHLNVVDSPVVQARPRNHGRFYRHIAKK